MDIEEEKIFEFRMINACTEGEIEVIAEYVESHDINKPLSSGWTLLLYAAFNAQFEIIEYLIENGADVNKHKDGFTPLMALCTCTKSTTEQHIKCLTLLITKGANANTSDKQRQTPLMYACMSQEPEFIRELLKYARNINTYDNRKRTALMYAVIANKLDTVKILLENKADTTIIDIDNLTAYDIASMKGYDGISSLLNFEEEETISTPEITKIVEWKDMFPSLININEHTIDFDVSIILYGMNLEAYKDIFQGMDLKVFLQLTENNLRDLGMDIRSHRHQFMEKLHEFHRKKWGIQSIGAINKSLSYTLYRGIISLGITAKQIAVIGSSFRYVKNSLLQPNNKNVYLVKKQMFNYEEELKKAEKSLDSLKNEISQIKAMFSKKKDSIGIPATYVGPKKRNTKWSMFLSIAIIIGIYVSKKGNIKLNILRY